MDFKPYEEKKVVPLSFLLHAFLFLALGHVLSFSERVPKSLTLIVSPEELLLVNEESGNKYYENRGNVVQHCRHKSIFVRKVEFRNIIRSRKWVKGVSKDSC